MHVREHGGGGGHGVEVKKSHAFDVWEEAEREGWSKKGGHGERGHGHMEKEGWEMEGFKAREHKKWVAREEEGGGEKGKGGGGHKSVSWGSESVFFIFLFFL